MLFSHLLVAETVVVSLDDRYHGAEDTYARNHTHIEVPGRSDSNGR